MGWVTWLGVAGLGLPVGPGLGIACVQLPGGAARLHLAAGAVLR